MCILAPRLLSALTFCVLSGLAATALQAQLPATRLGGVFPSGSGPNRSLEVTISGADLDDVDRLMFSHPGITAKQKMAEPGPFDKGPQPVANQFVVNVAGNVPIGNYEVRAVGKYGASNPRAFAIDDIPDAVETEPNNDIKNAMEFTIPAIVHGQSNQATDVDFYKFTVSARQRLIVASLTHSVDTPIDCTISVYDASGRVVGSAASADGQAALVDFVTTAAGEYVIKIHDSTFQGGAEHVYRLSVGALPHIDFVFPPAGLAGGNRPFTIFGRNLPGGKPSGLLLHGSSLDSVNVNIPLPGVGAAQALAVHPGLPPASASLDAIAYRIKGPRGSSQPVAVGLAAATPVLEAADNNTPSKAQTLKTPCEVMGKFFPQRDRDWFQFEAKKGDAIAIEVISQRFGMPTNPSLVVQAVTPAEGDKPEAVRQLAYVYESTALSGGPEFDTRHRDATYEFAVPVDGLYRVMVRDAYADVSPDPRRTYRLAIYKGQEDFRLAAVPEQSYSGVLIRKGGQAGIRVVAFRRNGFDGEIRCTATGLPAGVTCSDAVIGPGSSQGMLVLNAAANAAVATAAIQVVGKSKVGGAELTRQARYGAAKRPTAARTNPNQNIAAVDGRLTQNLTVSVSAGEKALVALQAGDGKIWETSRAGKLQIPVKRSGDFKGQINFIGRGLPGVNFPVANVPANKADGQVAVNLTRTIPPGTYTFYLDAIAQQVNYARNPEAAAAAAERKKEVDAIKTKADADAKTAATAKAAADKLATETTAAATAATNAKNAADKAHADATTTAAAAADNSAKAAASAAVKKEDKNLATAASAEKKAADDAAAKVATATTQQVVAVKALADATAKAKAAQEAKTLSDAKAAEATSLAQAAAQLKTQADQQATALTNAAKPKKINVPVVSTPITLKIAPAPVTLTEPKPASLKQGEKAEAAIVITRLFKYPGQVNFTTAIPQGVAGLSIPNISVPANQTQGKLTITAAATATEGEHQLTLRGTMNYNGQNLTVEQPLKLIVQKAAPKAN